MARQGRGGRALEIVRKTTCCVRVLLDKDFSFTVFPSPSVLPAHIVLLTTPNPVGADTSFQFVLYAHCLPGHVDVTVAEREVVGTIMEHLYHFARLQCRIESTAENSDKEQTSEFQMTTSSLLLGVLCCEYVTGGRVCMLGSVGINFAATRAVAWLGFEILRVSFAKDFAE